MKKVNKVSAFIVYTKVSSASVHIMAMDLNLNGFEFKTDANILQMIKTKTTVSVPAATDIRLHIKDKNNREIAVCNHYSYFL